MIENYYTQEQMEYFRKRRVELGPAAEEVAKKGQADWAELLADYRAAMEQGTDPSDPKLQALEKRRQTLVNAFSGGDKGIEQSLKRMWTEQGDKLCAQFGIDPKVMQYLAKAAEVSADAFLYTIEVMTMIEKYYTPEQLAQLDARAKAKEVPQEVIDKASQQWDDLFAAVTAEMEAGTDPADPKAQELAKRWLALVTLFTGGDPGIFNSLRNMYANEDNVMGMDTKAIRQKMEYILKAAAAAGIKHPGQ